MSQASGFWQMGATPWAAANSTIMRCVGGVVAMSTKSRSSFANSSAASVYALPPKAAAAALTRSASMSHTATSSASGISAQAWRWFCAKNPVPMTANR